VLAVEVPDAREEPVDPVARLDARHRVVAPEQAVVAAPGLVGDGLQLLARRAVEHREVLGPSTMKPSNSRSWLFALRLGAYTSMK
jgi:hypothetical protein